MIDLSERDLMIATPAWTPFSFPGWSFELKYDGFRILTLKEGKEVRLLTRNGNDLVGRFPEIVEDVSRLRGDLAIDGELVVADEHGHPCFYPLRRRAVSKLLRTIETAASAHPAQIMAFDILSISDRDVRKEPLLLRKKLLRKARQQKRKDRLR
jgi:bifunctional non-homologous end joining protein LigD